MIIVELINHNKNRDWRIIMANYSLEYMVRTYCGVISTETTKEKILEMTKENFSFKERFERSMNCFLENYFYMRQSATENNWDEVDELKEMCKENGKEAKKLVAFYAEFEPESIKLRFNPEDFN